MHTLRGPPGVAVDAAWVGRIHIYTSEYLLHTYLESPSVPAATLLRKDHKFYPF